MDPVPFTPSSVAPPSYPAPILPAPSLTTTLPPAPVEEALPSSPRQPSPLETVNHWLSARENHWLYLPSHQGIDPQQLLEMANQSSSLTSYVGLVRQNELLLFDELWLAFHQPDFHIHYFDQDEALHVVHDEDELKLSLKERLGILLGDIPSITLQNAEALAKLGHILHHDQIKEELLAHFGYWLAWNHQRGREQAAELLCALKAYLPKKKVNELLHRYLCKSFQLGRLPRHGSLPEHFTRIFALLDQLVLSNTSYAESELIPLFIHHAKSHAFPQCVRVMARLPSEYFTAFFELCEHLPELRKVEIDGDQGAPDDALLDQLGQSCRKLTHLTIHGQTVPRLSRFPEGISNLTISGNPNLRQIKGLPPSLHSLTLKGCPKLKSLEGFPPSLRLLEIREGCASLTKMKEIPANLKGLILTGLPGVPMKSFPSTLEALSISRCTKRWKLPPLPQGLKLFELWDSKLKKTGPLPRSLEELTLVGGPDLAPPAELPQELVSLRLSLARLQVLPPLSSKVQKVELRCPRLHYIPPFPDELASLQITSSKIEQLPYFPANLRLLELDCPKLIHLPPFPLQLRYLSCSEYDLLDKTLPPNLFRLIVDGKRRSTRLIPPLSH